MRSLLAPVAFRARQSRKIDVQAHLEPGGAKLVDSRQPPVGPVAQRGLATRRPGLTRQETQRECLYPGIASRLRPSQGRFGMLFPVHGVALEGQYIAQEG